MEVQQILAPLAGFLGLILFVLFIIYILFSTVRDLRKANDSLHWPTTTGRILTPGTRTVTYHVSAADGGGSNEVQESVVRYSYTVDGAEFSTERISFGGGQYASSKKDHAKYQPGDTVKFYYNPSDPSEAVLETGIRWTDLGGMVVLLILLFFLLQTLLQTFIR